MNRDTYTVEANSKPGPLPKALAALADELELLRSTTDELTRRLDSVLVPETDKPGTAVNNSVGVTSSAVVRQAHNYVDIIRIERMRLNNLLERLEL